MMRYLLSYRFCFQSRRPVRLATTFRPLRFTGRVSGWRSALEIKP